MTDPFAAFADLAQFAALPRVEGLAMSPDGRRLVVGVKSPNEERNRYLTSLWEVDPAGQRPARRLTRSAKGESAPVFTPAGDLLFVSARPDGGGGSGGTGGKDEQDPPAALWLLPAGGGEPRVVATRPGGVARPRVAREAGTVVLSSSTLPSATDADSDKDARDARKDAKVAALLHEEYPVRYWDHDLGPGRNRLLAADLAGDAAGGDVAAGERRLDLRDLTGHVGSAVDDEASWDVSADGRTVVTTWQVPEARGSRRTSVVAIDVATGERRVLADDEDVEYWSPQISPDGRQVAVIAARRSTPQEPPRMSLAVVPLAGGEVRDLTGGWDRWPKAARWTPDGDRLVVAADDTGRGPLFLVDGGTGQVRRITADDGAYDSAAVSPDGRWVYAVRSALDSPPAPVRVALPGSLDADPVEPEPLPSPVAAPTLPGRVEEVTATAQDGTALRAWLVLPEGADAARPAPLLLTVHGGPLSSWNAWSWRWNPWALAARGYAVLLPDPALSTGYGIEHIRRSWGSWGDAAYTDLMSVTDATVARDDVDADRTAAIGGSFGGYMANWIAGHTDRFRAIVTHASLWALEQFEGTTDSSQYWTREMTPEMTREHSPHRFVDQIVTPMLVIHGDKDYRVPIGEGLRLWWDLMSRVKDPDSNPHKFLYFPDENHWVLTPNHARLWYETVLAFLDHHVLGEPWRRPDLLG